MRADEKHIHTARHPDNGRIADVSFDKHDGVYLMRRTTALGEDRDRPEIFDPSRYEQPRPGDRDAAARADAIESADDFVSEHATNTETLVRIMEDSDTGVLMQAFVIDGLLKHAESVIAATDEALGGRNSLVNPSAWRACATELKTALEKHLER